MGRPLIYDIVQKPASSFLIALCSAVWLFIQKKNVGYADVGLSYEAIFSDGQHWRLLTSAFSHISFLHLVFNMSALWSLGVVERLKEVGLGIEYYIHYSLVLLILSALAVLGMYHTLIHRFKLDYYKRVTAVGYSCIVFGWMTILAAKQPSSKLELFGVLSLPISFAPFESLVFTSIIAPQASFIGHLAGILVGYLIAWGVIQGMSNYWAITIILWLLLLFLYSIHQTSYHLPFLHIEPVANSCLPAVGSAPLNIEGARHVSTIPWTGSQLV
ncbi:hypothetical protein O6H91_11G074500 [Diphasiastrum complanatum]|uniref:Uncharacterized protein n=1 Tax=Diphasiastrum complanatum TaxID=34168 RepID=A0ACC2CAH5_DIPCM|nr:hypothetical protein O6H91_11G074500 [Diphasiastrum complanatum]